MNLQQCAELHNLVLYPIMVLVGFLIGYMARGYDNKSIYRRRLVRAITVNTCHECPYKDHSGGFGAIAYIPRCSKVNIDLPYDKGVSGTRIVAKPTGVIPDWCPLTTVVSTAEGEVHEEQ